MGHKRPPLKVSRPVAACSKCRQAKIKCDGALPACSSCTKQGKTAECVSTNDNFARGKERSYVSTLESKIERLEQKLKNTTLPSGADPATLDPTREVERSRQLAVVNPVKAKAAKRQEASDIDDIVSDFGYLYAVYKSYLLFVCTHAFSTINATARDYYGFTAFFTYSRLVLSACRCQLGLVDDTSIAFPSRDAVSADIQHYITRIHPLLPFCDEAAIYYSLNAVFHPSRALATHFDHWVVAMVLAIVHASQSACVGDQHFLIGRAYANAAIKSRATHVLQPGAVTGIQAMLFLLQYAMFDPHALDLWSLIGATSRLMIDLGLHQDGARHKAKLETQRRIFYCIYVLDRMSSILYYRAHSFSDDAVDVTIPSAPSVSSIPDRARHDWLRSIHDHVAMVQLRKIQSVWYHDLFLSGIDPMADAESYIWKCYQDLDALYLRASPTMTTRTTSCFELELLFAKIRVLTPSPRTPPTTDFTRHILFDRAIDFAQAIQARIASSAAMPIVFYEALAVFAVACDFASLLDQSLEMLITASTPPTTPDIEASLVPNLTRYSRPYRLSSTRAGIHHFSTAIERLGTRYDCLHWKRTWDDMLLPVWRRLTALE